MKVAQTLRSAAERAIRTATEVDLGLTREHSDYGDSSTQLLHPGSPPRSGSSGEATEWTPLHLVLGCLLLNFLFSSGTAVGLGWGYLMVARPQCPLAGNPAAGATMADEVPPPRPEVPEPLAPGTCYEALMNITGVSNTSAAMPFKFITHRSGHKLPEMYGHVPEKTIWTFWHDPEACRDSAQCAVPPHIQLCMDTVRHNKGSFDYRLIHMDEVEKYVSMFELPLHWHLLQPAQKKESLMNALLARYGGVAVDASMVLLRPLDDYWNEMVSLGATFRGYLYRLNGQPWHLAQTTAPWFLMSRREGIFSTAVRTQHASMCLAYLDEELALGDNTLTPILSMFNYSLPTCYADATVVDKDSCPELGQPMWSDSGVGPARNDRKLLLRDPRDGPLLPFALLEGEGMGSFKVSADTQVTPAVEGCSTMRDCWDNIFMPRFEAPNAGSTRPLEFVKLFHGGGGLRHKPRKALLADTDSYFFNWLRLAGLPDAMPPAPAPAPTPAPATNRTGGVSNATHV